MLVLFVQTVQNFCLKSHIHFSSLSEKMPSSSRNITVLIVATKYNHLTFCFCQKGQPEGIRSSNTYTLTDVRRNATGEYKCSLVDKKSMIASTAITVHCESPSSLPASLQRPQIVQCDYLFKEITASVFIK